MSYFPAAGIPAIIPDLRSMRMCRNYGFAVIPLRGRSKGFQASALVRNYGFADFPLPSPGLRLRRLPEGITASPTPGRNCGFAVIPEGIAASPTPGRNYGFAVIPLRGRSKGFAKNASRLNYYGRLPLESKLSGKASLNNKKPHKCGFFANPFAERKGFEPPVPVREQRFSRPPRSTTPAPLQKESRRV